MKSNYKRLGEYIREVNVRNTEWDDFCDMQLPVPSIEKQQEIVAEYKTVTNRIEINNRLIQKLEETAQAIYKQWFVDFEFPDEEGKPYKSNGGEMVESEMGEVPKGWRVGKLGEILELQRGFDLPSQNRKFGKYPIYASTGIAQLHNEYKVKAPCVVTGRSGSLGEVFYVNEDFWPLNTTLWVKDFKASKPLFVFFLLKSINLLDYNDGSAVPTLNRNAVHLHQIMIPDMETIEKFDNLQKNLFSSIKICVTELSLLERMKVLLLAKMVKEII